MTEEQIVEYETAKLATEKGFDTRTNKYYGETKEHSYEDVRNHREDIVVEARPPHLKTTLYMDTHSHTTFLCYAPSQSVLHQWLRDEHGMYVSIYPLKTGWAFDVRPTYGENMVSFTETHEGLSSYESALERGLNEGLKLI